MMKMHPTRFAGVLFLTLALTFSPFLVGSAEAARISLIRDAEIENTIETYATPLFKAAGLDADAVRVHIVKDPSLNAFVAGGMNLFLNTGLLLAAKSPGQIIGVIAHETGHIVGGHLARTEEALRGASTLAILSYVLGAAAAAAGSGAGASAIIMGSQGVARQTMLNYTRSQERAADQFAVTVLDRTHQSAEGLASFLELLSNQEALLSFRRDPYLRTHPLTMERIAFIRHHVETSPYSANKPPAEWVAKFKRMQGKLFGFLKPAAQTFARYPKSDRSVEARYARAVANFRRGDLDGGPVEINSLLAEYPDDPYFHELKGQMLFENGHVAEAVAPYRRAVELAPDIPLLRAGLARVLIETGKSEALSEAASNLEDAVRRDPRMPRAWRLLAIAYGRTGKPGASALASAEFTFRVGRYGDAITFAKRAIKRLPAGSPRELRAEDIQGAAQRAIKKKREKD